MARMFEDNNGDRRRKDGRKAGQSRRKIHPPRTIQLSPRVSVPFEDAFLEQMEKGGYRSQADFLEDLLAAYLFLTRQGAMPSFARLDDKV